MSDVSSLRVIAHPVRLRMLSILTGSAMSAADLARELGISHANASYHLRQLAEADEVVEAGERTIRGGVAKLYRYPDDPDDQPPSGPDASTEDRLLYVRAVGTELERRTLARQPGRPGLVADLEGWVDPDTWERALGLLKEASRLLHGANQPPHSPGTDHVSFTAWAFQMDQA
ncbi:helix-turn-helix domain-containing protein [uncultured Nocardioides sp.]|uniref:ArsR/SmtB family transcription factor n=1 Tax=uncultured Nocardioides sp. TaxID=198441 RepID=UPI002606E435|nr:helix-turn-helix domain-containing protein [uncultured Nocardioides sp.]